MADGLFHSPPPIDMASGNVAENFRKFKQRFEIFMIASGKDKQPEHVKTAILLNLVGDEAVEVFNTFTFDKEESKSKLEHVLSKFEEYCNPRKNLIFEQSKFFTHCQMEGETYDHFLTTLKKMAASCEFKDQLEQMLTLRVVLGIHDKTLRERLLRVPELTLQQASENCRAAEASKSQLEQLENLKIVDATKLDSKYKSPAKQSSAYDCKFCGYRHAPRKCPAYSQNCSACKKMGHFSKMCRLKRRKAVQEVKSAYDPNNEPPSDDSEDQEEGAMVRMDSVGKKMEDVPTREDSEEDWATIRMDSVGIDAVAATSGPTWTADLLVAEKLLTFKLDTGAEANILPYRYFKTLENVGPLHKTKIKLVAFGNSIIVPNGVISLDCVHGEISVKLKFVVTPTESVPLLGLEACVQLGLIKKIGQVKNPNKVITKADWLKEYDDVFSGLGCLPGEYTIRIKTDAVPKVEPSRRVPLALRDRLKEKLNSLEKQEIIEKVTHPTDWVHNLVVVEKLNGDLRLCLDPTVLNRSVKREHYPIPVAEDVIACLTGKKFFSILDMKDGFHQVKLDKSSSDLCTFSTPFGRYKYLRLPFGLASSPEVFQRMNNEIFGDIKDVQIIFDDIIVSGETQEAHDKVLRQVLERALQAKVKFNATKFQHGMKEVTFMGQKISDTGVRVDPERIRAIVDMPAPKNVADVRRFLGMLNFVHQYIPNMSTVSSPLRQLLRSDVEWAWEHEQEKSFKELKTLLGQAPVLAYFDPKKKLILQVDSSKDGMGACLVQDGHPIAFASRSLSDTEQAYAQIEKELNAIVFGLTRFHFYVYGRKVLVQTDHKPLVSIATKNVNKVAPRLQRMQLKIIKYDIDIMYLPGKQMVLADTLSRASLQETDLDDPEMDVLVHSVSKHMPLTPERRLEFQRETEKWEVAQQLKELVMNGWPDHRNKVPSACKYYYSMQDDITLDDGLIFVGFQMLVPPTLRAYMLGIVHEGHFGIEKSRQRARSVVFWPGMSQEIYDFVKKCVTCERFGRNNSKEPLISHPIPDRAWQTLAADICECNGKTYLVVKDYFSKWIEVVEMNSKTATEVSLKLQSIFSRFGIPDTVMSDNMPFASWEFKQFATKWNFCIKSSSPRYAKSNGMAENGVNIVKTMLKKACFDHQNVYRSLLEYRNTPITGLGLSPAQLLMCRNLKSRLPMIASELQPVVQRDARDRLKRAQENQQKFHDKGARELPVLRSGENIVLRRNGVWEPAVVKAPHAAPRSYIVKTEQGAELRRNRRFLRRSTNVFQRKPDIEMQVREENRQNEMVREENRQNETNAGEGILQTRSGRVVNRPRRLEDYV
jgi:RNase H-like domain found in reverse transcriptase/Reverse transcriptase (RNA-dependent DNA polymerase)/Integrase zinc binding domain